MSLSRILITVVSVLFCNGHTPAMAEESAAFVDLLLAQGVSEEQLLGFDHNGIPLVCGTSHESMHLRSIEPRTQRADLPPGTRAWECVPGVIRNDGVESFLVEVDVNGEVAGVTIDSVSGYLVAPGPKPITMHDDGLEGDRTAGDFVFTAGPFRYDTGVTMPEYYLNDPSSPAGLYATTVGTVDVEELDGTTTQFLIAPEIGLLRSDILETASQSLDPNIVVSPHLVNIQSDAHETQRFIRFLGGDPRNLTTQIYAILPDAVDFFMFFSTNKIERLPRTSSQNFTAGVHTQAQTDFSGTGLTIFDGTAAYGSDGVLLGANVLDAFSRGIRGGNATHELIHQWVSYTNTSLGLSDGTAHYEARSSAASLVGGFQWVDNGDGTFTLNCDEGRNGAHRAPPIDKYMMGLIEGTAVSPLQVNDEVSFPTDCGGTIESLLDVTIQDIQGVHGARSPGPADARRDFRIAFVAESHNRLLNPTELTYYDMLAEHYTRPIPPEEPAPFIGENWPSVERFFEEGTTWTTTIPVPVAGIPAVSTWGILATMLTLLVTGTIVIRRRCLPVRS